MKPLALLLIALVLCAPARAADAPPQLGPAARADGAVVVPDRFLRRWDPVTVFFDQDSGTANGGPEDAPERLVAMTPAQPGAWQWLGPRVLQFRPAEPWQPLRRVTVQANGRAAVTLVPLLPAPVETAPPDKDEGIANLDTISLTFPDPVDAAALARLLSIELRPIPGLDAAGGQVLTAQDFRVEPMERAARADKQTYLIRLRQPVPDGRVAILRLRLSDAAGLDDPTFELRLRSATAFKLTDLYCGPDYTHDTQSGVTRCTRGDTSNDTASDDASNVADSKPAKRGTPEIDLHFSEAVQPLDIVQARQALRLTPPVDDLDVSVSKDGHDYRVKGRFAPDTVYSVDLAPGAVSDTRGRPLAEAVSQRFAFRADPPSLRWDASQGLVERLGPQMVPLRGHGYARADLRIHRVDPLGRDFWPFPPGGVATRDDAAPPLPGNEPDPWTGAEAIAAPEIAARLKALGSPDVSDLVDLPTRRGGADAKFGLDLKPFLARIAGDGQPGAYLVGLRPLESGERQWLRIQVTDLSLTAVEEAGRVRFAVTSLSSARPVAGAQIRLEGARADAKGDAQFVTLAQGTTDADGAWLLPARVAATPGALRRIVVLKGVDTLALDAVRGPERYANGTWSDPHSPWLGWLFARNGAVERLEKPRTLCHVFTERPIYRPEEAVEIRGFVRGYFGGALSFESGAKGTLVVHGPDDQEWRYKLALDDTSGFYQRFDAKTEATGDYTAEWIPDGGTACGQAGFKKEAYRLPTFEVLLNAPPGGSVPLDAPFPVGLLARYYAGGLVADRPVHWRVKQFPFTWTPPKGDGSREGFLFSSDARYADSTEFRSTPVLVRDAKLDAGGSAQLTLDPTLEPTAQPRRYDVEATVTGDDDLQVRSVAHITALPPFVLGVKVPRYLPQPGTIEPEVLAVDAEGKPLAGIAMTARLIRRDWNAVLAASDFSQGSAKYVTQQLDRVLDERKLDSTDASQSLRFDAKEAGIYLLELTAEDKAGRRQTVRVDLFMAGGTPVTWSRPPSRTVTVTTDKDDYAPGETATLLVQSPFQTARALAVTEEPDGQFRYDWVDIQDGYGRYAVPVLKEATPRLAVHLLLMRGRLPGPAQAATAPFDQGKPTTLAATAWVKVRPVKNQLTVTLEAPVAARPAQTVDVTLRLTDDENRPVSGEATFWMVDQAVLALAQEAPLDPLPRFIVDRPARMTARDTRNMAFGVIPLQENPGGSAGEEERGIENISVRKNFTPVPVYLPHVKIGPDGVVHLKVALPDTLTVFMLRAEATSGPDRFGYGTGRMQVRQPVVAQAVLPRFLRPGDRFEATALGRIVEGPAGSGSAAISADGVDIEGSREQDFAWDGQHPARAAFAASVPQPKPGPETTATPTALIRFLVRRRADGAGDAVQIALPIRPDRPAVRRRRVLDLGAGASLTLPPPDEASRPDSYATTISVAADPALVRSLGALSYLLAYPIGCTEQRIALASAELALQPFAAILASAGLDKRIADDVAIAAHTIAQNVDEDGLVALFPQTRGSVWLTAFAYEFLVRAEKAGLTVDVHLRDRLAAVLAQALRSDYAHLFAGEALRERTIALWALQAGGKLDAAYTAELARRASVTATDGLALMIAAIAAQKDPGTAALLPGLLDTLWSRVQILARDGKPVYAGLSDWGGDPLILPSETRGLADALRAVALAAPGDPRLPVLRAGLVGLGGGDGWGSTNADAAALGALASSWGAAGGTVPVAASLPDGNQRGTLDAGTPLLRWTTTQPGPVVLRNGGAQGIVALHEVRYVPDGPGSAASPVQEGFVVSRSLYRVPVGDAPMERLSPEADGAIKLTSGDVVEELAEVVNPEDRTLIAIRLPLAAGLEPLNPNLATAPAEATPSAGPSLAPTYVAFGDDSVLYVYDRLPKGTYRFRFRSRAATPGSFTQPPGEAEMMYRDAIHGASAGARIDVTR